MNLTDQWSLTKWVDTLLFNNLSIFGYIYAIYKKQVSFSPPKQYCAIGRKKKKETTYLSGVVWVEGGVWWQVCQ